MLLLKKANRILLTLICVMSSSIVLSQTTLSLPSILGDHMVLQQNESVRFWGWANPRTTIRIIPSWSNDTIHVKANEKAKWETNLETPGSGGPYQIELLSAGQKLLLKDVMIGELWLCSGQSNMEWSAAKGVIDAKEALDDSYNNEIRFFFVDKATSDYPQDDIKGHWKVCSPESLKWFSAVGYFFGKKLHDKLNVPIGLINSSWGGTSAETWTPSEYIPKNSPLFNASAYLVPSTGWDNTIGSTYNAMIHPLIKMKIAGTIWYQGEANCPNAYSYSELMKTLIRSWRERFEIDFPFYYVQIAPYLRYPIPYSAAIVREEQAKLQSMEKTGMVVVSDLVDNLNDIHPKYKKEVGNRLANYALAETYNKDIQKYKFASLKEQRIEKNSIRIYFNDLGGQLKIKGNKVQGLEIAGDELMFYEASGTVDDKNKTLLVKSDKVKSPKYVRYAFANGVVGNLFDNYDLPVAPFRTDEVIYNLKLNGKKHAANVEFNAQSRTDRGIVPLPLKSAANNGIGHLSLPYLRNKMLGSASVFNSEGRDLFVFGTGGHTSGVYMLKWLQNSEAGIPIFDEPIKVNGLFSEVSTVFEIGNTINALWIRKDTLIHSVFDKDKLAFEINSKLKVPGLPAAIKSLSAVSKSDRSLEIFFEVGGHIIPSKYPGQNPYTANWKPYDEAGISTSKFNYNYIYSACFQDFPNGEIINIKQLTKTDKEILYSMVNTTPVCYGKNKPKGVIAGSKLGVFTFYDTSNLEQKKFAVKGHIVGEDENILRHPSVSASLCLYSENKDFIAAGEGALYFYQFTGRHSKLGNPIYKKPVAVLQMNADLYAGTLPVPSVYDWDGDGVQDLIVGNSEGYVLFFKNIGCDDFPKFLPGERIQADGKDIHIQAGYSGSVQGTGEARWGYTSPTVVDWTGNGLPDIIMGDITGNYTVYINDGTLNQPNLQASQPLYCDGLELHGMWRSRAAIGDINHKKVMIIVDGNDAFHLYWKIDDYNVEDGGVLLLSDGSVIQASAEPAGGTGRCKLSLFDFDGDGKLDLIIGNSRRSAIPNKETGYPMPVFGKKALATPLLMRNIGDTDKLVFEHPVPFNVEGVGLLQPGGAHESGAIGTSLGGGNRRNLIVGNELGRLYLIKGESITQMSQSDIKKYINNQNPLFKKHLK